MHITRRKTRQIAVGSVKIGGDAPVSVQSMCSTDTRDTSATIEQISGVLQKAGSSIANVASVNVYLTKAEDFAAMNEVYGTYFPQAPPARATVQVARLPREARVEIMVTAAR